MSDVTNEGERLIQNWKDTQVALDRAKSNLTRAECDHSNAETALAKWLTPTDAAIGEKIAVWYGADLVQVEVVATGKSPKVTWRKRGIL